VLEECLDDLTLLSKMYDKVHARRRRMAPRRELITCGSLGIQDTQRGDRCAVVARCGSAR
jgi:hypothetical protein